MSSVPSGTLDRLRMYSLALAAVAALIGGFMLGAWFTGAAARWSAAGVITAKTNMALALPLGGIALILLNVCYERCACRWVGLAAGAVVLLLGGLTLGEHLAGWDLGIDQLLAKEAAGAPGVTSPNRMGPPGSVSLAFLGLALLLLGTGRRRMVPHLGLVVLLINLFPAVGYLYGVAQFFSNSHLTGIAWPTVVALLCLGSGLVLSCPETGPMPLLVRDDAGGRLLRGMLPVAILLPLGLGFLRVLGEYRGLYEKAVGLGLFTLTLVVLFSLILWLNAGRLSGADERQKRAENALRDSEQRLRATFNNAALGIVEVTGDDRIIDANERMCQMLGYRCGELLGKSIRELTAPEDRQQSDDFNAEIRAGRRDRMEYEKRYLQRDGKALWVRVAVTPLHDPEGRWVGAIGTVEDIQQRKEAEERVRQLNRDLTLRNAELEAERARWQGVVEGMAEEVWTCDAQGRISLLNLGATTMNLREFRDKPVEQVLKEVEILYPDGQPCPPDQSPLLRSLRGEVVRGEEIMRHRQSGITRWRQYSSAPTRDAAGQITGAVAIVRDITEQKRAADLLARNQAVLNQAGQMAHLGAWDIEVVNRDDVNANALHWSDEVYRIFGYEPGQVQVTNELFFERVHPDDRPKVGQAVAEAIAQHRSYQVEHRIIRADGVERVVIEHADITFDQDGRPLRIVGAVQDITERKRAAEDLRESEQRVRRKLDALLAPEGDIGTLELADIIDVPAVQALVGEAYKLMRIPMAIIDLQGRVLVGVGWQEICIDFHRRHPETCQYCIESDTQLTMGVAPEEFRLYRCKNNMWDCATPILIGGKHVGNLFTGQFFFDDEVVDRELFRAQGRRYGFDEEQYLAALDAVPRLSREAVQTGMRFFIRLADMLSQLSYSNIKLARFSEQLAAAKLSAERARNASEEANKAKDQFLAVLSHELRTPLTPVVAAISMLQEGGHDEQTNREAMEMIHRNVEMEARLIDDLLDVTRIVRGKIELRRQPTILCEVIRRAVEVCKPDIDARRIHLGVDIGPCAPHQIDADPGRLQQVFWNLLQNAVKFTPQGGCIGIRCRREDDHVIAEVVDSGEGIEPHLLPHIFNPFEQGGARITRQFGGLGLGLTITKGVVEMHGGTVEAHSEGKGKGATFRVRLPLYAAGVAVAEGAPAEGGERRASAAPARTQKLRILLVEDHGDTAKVMRRLLTGRGYEVEVAGDVATALGLAERELFDLLLSDLGLPDGSGVDLMRSLREHGRTLPGIALSGYGQDEDIRRSKEAGFAAHLIKPTDPDVLTRTIGTVIHAGAARTT